MLIFVLSLKLGLEQINRTPTRGTSILDLILTNDPLIVSHFSIGMPLGSSDHDSIAINVVFLHGKFQSDSMQGGICCEPKVYD